MTFKGLKLPCSKVADDSFKHFLSTVPVRWCLPKMKKQELVLFSWTALFQALVNELSHCWEVGGGGGGGGLG